MRDVARAVVAEPFNLLRCSHDVGEAVLDGSQHHVAHHIATVAAGRRRPTHRFTVAAIQRERDAQRLAILAAEFEAIRAPALVALGHRDSTVVPALR